MTRQVLLNSAATAAATTQAEPARLPAASEASQSPTSPEALERLNEAVAAIKLTAIMPLLRQAVIEVTAENHQKGADLALRALDIDPECGVAWHVLGVCREKAGDYTSSLSCYDSALKLNPEEVELANDLGRLAYVMGMKEEAEGLFRYYHSRRPDSLDAVNNIACCQRDNMRFEEAIETIRPAIYGAPENGMLWNTLGTIMAEMGDMEQASTFLEEALRLQPDFPKARYNLANAKLALGDPVAALADCDEALPGAVLESEVAMMNLARATILLASSRLGEGFDAYEARMNPRYADATMFVAGEETRQLTPEDSLAGKHLMMFGEQGLGDEILFANIIPDVIEALGPDGGLTLAVERRLVPLFKRSFPNVRVGEHVTAKIDHHAVRFVRWMEDWSDVDFWTPMASPLRSFRRSLEDFPDRRAFLVPDPARVEHWKSVLASLGDGPKVGVVWKSLKINSGRQRYFSPFEQWKPVLQTPGVKFVNLQYGECAEELAKAKGELGVEIWNPPGIDLKDDLDDVAALTSALDLVVGPANASTNIAAACGAPVWLLSTPGAWPRLGTDRYPWYPSVRVFLPPAYNRWGPAMEAMAAALKSLAAGE